jgi:DNA-binding transcriptional LysR family regulator
VEIKQLRHFLAVIDAGSISDAARKLRMSQGAVSLSIQALERDAGAPLFIRSSEGVAPNEVGRTLEARARLISNEIGRAEREIHELLGIARGRVVIGTVPHFADPILPRVIIRFQGAHPGVEISVINGHVSALVAAVKSGVVDFALATLPSEVAADAELAHQVFMPTRSSQIYAAAANPLAARRRVSARELLSCPWALPSTSDLYRTKFVSVFARLGLAAPAAAVEYSSISMLRRLVCEGPYVAFFSKVVLQDEIERGLVKRVRAPELRWESENATGAFFRRGASLSPAAEKLIDMIKAVARETNR